MVRREKKKTTRCLFFLISAFFSSFCIYLQANFGSKSLCIITIIHCMKPIVGDRFHRSMTRPFFTKDRISHFEIFDHHADEAIHQLKTRLNEGYAVDIQVGSGRFFIHNSIHLYYPLN